MAGVRDKNGGPRARWVSTLVLLVILFRSWMLPADGRAITREEGAHLGYLPAILLRPSIGNVDHLLIVEVLYDPSSEGDLEWFEVFNPTGETIDLTSYKIGDEETLGGSEGMLGFPPGSSIGPLRLIIIAENALDFQTEYGFPPDYEIKDSGSPVPELIKYTPWAGGQVNLSNTGDELILLDRYDEPLDAVSWGSSHWAFDPPVGDVQTGNSLERVPGYIDTDTAADWLSQAAPGPGGVDLSRPTPVPTLGPTPTPLLEGFTISEVYYDPIGDEPAGEWMEFYNAGEEPIDLAYFKVGDAEIIGDSEGMYRFPGGWSLGPGEAVVVAREGQAFFMEFGTYPDFEMVDTLTEVPEMIKHLPWSGGTVSLANGGDEVLLLGSQDQLLDSVSWGSSSWAFDPPAAGASSGQSLERFPPEVDSDSAADWRVQDEPNPGEVTDASGTPAPPVTDTPTGTLEP